MVYLDANATSRLRPEVARFIGLLLESEEPLGNPSSVHAPGRNARRLLKQARKRLLECLFEDDRHQAEQVQVIFTSGGTEACNAMIFGFLGKPLSQLGKLPGHIVVSAIEHQSVLEPVNQLEESGWKVSRVQPDCSGIIGSEAVTSQVTKDTLLVSVMGANNVTGVVQPIEQISKKLREKHYSGPIVCDFTQAFGKSSLSALSLFKAGVDAISLSGHKIGTPAGIGALVMANGEKNCRIFHPLSLGGPQQERLRAGTENLIGAAAFGCAAELVSRKNGELMRIAKLRNSFWQTLSEEIPNAVLLSPIDEGGVKCLTNTFALRVPGVRADDLVVALDLQGICLSSGSACASGKQKVSHVFRAFLDEQQAKESFRISLDWDADKAPLESAAPIIAKTVKRICEGGLSL